MEKDNKNHSAAPKQFYSIQYLRAIAALLVVYCHAIDLQMLYGVSLQQNFLYLQNFGAIGVDIFFVISGFIISYVSPPKVGIKAAINFIKKRFIRINPTYYFATGLLALFIFFSDDFKISLIPLIKSLTILPIFESGERYIAPLLTVGWTLSFEWFFYLLFAILITMGVKSNNRELYLVFIFIGLSIIGLFVNINEQHWLFITNPLYLEFGFGLIVAILFRKYNNKLKSKAISIILIILACTIFMALIITGYSDISEAYLILNGQGGWLRILIWGIPSLLLFTGMLFYELAKEKNYYKNNFLILLGNASFSIYLTHEIIFLFFEKYNFKILNYFNQDLLILLFVILAAILGILFHKCIEKYIIKKAQQLFEYK